MAVSAEARRPAALMRGPILKPTSLLVADYPGTTTAGTSHIFSVTAKDAFGNTATGYAGTVHFTSSDGQAALQPTQKADDNKDQQHHQRQAASVSRLRPGRRKRLRMP